MNAKTSSRRRFSTPWRLILSCEHASHNVPREFAKLFDRHRPLLESHRGWDIGAVDLTKALARRLNVSPFLGKATRLLVELNRSPRHPKLFSEVTRSLPRDQLEGILHRYYWPYRRTVESAVSQTIAAGIATCHLSVHSFTPILDGEVRRADIGLLYDPQREGECRWSNDWIDALHETLPEMVVRRNYPYRGTADGLTTFLRRKFHPSQYLGIELEVNQRWPLGHSASWKQVIRGIGHALERSWPLSSRSMT